MLRSTRTNLATTQFFSTAWMDNFFANLDVSLTRSRRLIPLSLFRRATRDYRLGGSFARDERRLTSLAKGRAVIIAAGSTINPLLKHGVEPDLLVSFDR